MQKEVFKEIDRLCGAYFDIWKDPESANQLIALSGHMDTVHPIGCF